MSTRLQYFLISQGIACVFIAACYFIFASDATLMVVLFDTQSRLGFPLTVQNLMWLATFAGAAELVVRQKAAAGEELQLELKLLPEDDSTMLRAQDLGETYARATAISDGDGYFLQRLIKRIVLQFQSSSSVSQAHTILNSSLELFQHEIDLRYTAIRYIVWLIPTLGFIGTVIGIALALNDAGSATDLSDPSLLSELTESLGVAFYTTLLSLLQSSVLVLGLSLIQQQEEGALNKAGNYCVDNLVNRLYEK